MGVLVEKAKVIRASMQLAGRTVPDEVAFSMPTFFDLWKTGIAYTIGDKRRHSDGKLYKCLQAHTSQSDWAPNVAVSLWVRIDDPAIAWPDFRQPTGAQDAYGIGAQVTFNGKHYKSLIAANVWSPTGYPAGWQLMN